VGINSSNNNLQEKYNHLKKEVESLKSELNAYKTRDKTGNSTGNPTSLPTTSIYDQNDYLTKLIELLPGGIIIESAGKKIIKIDPKCCRLFALPHTPDHYIGKDIGPVYGDFKSMLKEPEKFIAHLDLLHDKGEAVFHEELAMADGRILDRDFIPFKTSSGERHFIWHYRDITEQKKNNEALIIASEQAQAKQQFIQRIFRTTPDVLYVFDILERKPVYQKRNVAEVMGFTAEEMLEMGDNLLIEVAHPEDLPRILEHFQNLSFAKDNEILRLEYRMRDKQNNYHWFLSKDSVFLRDNKGKVRQIIGTATEITHRKILEQQVRDSEMRYRSVVEDMPGLLCRFYADGTLEYINQNYAQTFGKSVEELEGQSFLQFIPETFKDGVLNNILSLTPENPVLTHENPVIISTGEIKWYRWTNRLLPQAPEKPMLFQAFGEDVTAQKQIEAERDAVYQRNEALVKALSEIVYEWWPLKNELLWLGDFERILGYSSEEMGNTTDSWTRRVHPDDLDRVLKEVEEASKAKRDYNLEYRFLQKNGHYRWMYDQGILFFNAENELERIVGVFRDISRRKQYEIDLESSRNRLALATKVTGLGIYEYDVPMGDNSYHNERWAEILGYTMDELPPSVITMDWIYTNTHPDDVPGMESMLKDFFEGKIERYELELRMQHKSGEWRWIKQLQEPKEKDEYGIIKRVIGVSLDIQERKQTEEALKQSEERYQTFIKQSSEGIYRMEMKVPVDISIPLEVQIDQIYEHAYLAECNEAFIKMYELNAIEDVINLNLKEFHGGSNDPVNRGIVREFVESGYRIVEKETFEETASGSKCWFSNNTIGIIEDGKLTQLWGTQLNITERKDAEQALVESKLRLSEAQKIAKLGDFMWNVKSGEVTWSEGMYDLLAYEPGEKIDFEKVNKEMHHPDDLKEVTRWLNESLSSGEHVLPAKEYRLIKKSGEVIDVRTKGIIEYDNKKAVKVFATVQDITESKRIEKEIKSQRERLAYIIEGTNVGTWEWNVQTGETVFNEKWANIIGYTLEEISPVSIDTWMKYAHPDDLKQSEALLQQHFRGKTDYYHFEGRMKHRNGDWVWVLDRGKVISWTAEGAPLWMFGTHQEITERRRMEEAILQERNLSNVIIDSAPGMFYLFDENGKFIRWNDNFEKTTGYSNREISNLHPTELFEGADRMLIKQRIQKVFDEGYADAEADLLTKQGNKIPYFLNGINIKYGGRNCLIGLGFDISERKKAERSIKQQNEALRKTNQELDNFVYRVSHDIRAPISSAKGLINIARLETEEIRKNKCLEMIEKSLNKLDYFILDILDYSRNSRVGIKTESIDFETLIDDVISNTSYLQQERKVNIQSEISGKDKFYSDRIRLIFIFNNLVSNAIRFSDEDRDDSHLYISVKISPTEAVIHFSDNGVGIPKEHLSRIFDMFYRANENSTGSGLGLYIVKEAVDKLNGYITVHSELQAGTTFVLTIPNMKKVKA